MITVKVECSTSNSIRVVINEYWVVIEKKLINKIFELFMSIPTDSVASGTDVGKNPIVEPNFIK